MRMDIWKCTFTGLCVHSHSQSWNLWSDRWKKRAHHSERKAKHIACMNNSKLQVKKRSGDLTQKRNHKHQLSDTSFVFIHSQTKIWRTRLTYNLLLCFQVMFFSCPRRIWPATCFFCFLSEWCLFSNACACFSVRWVTLLDLRVSSCRRGQAKNRHPQPVRLLTRFALACNLLVFIFLSVGFCLFHLTLHRSVCVSIHRQLTEQ